MKTKIYLLEEDNLDMKIIDKASETLKAGELVSFPTETVYGLGADGLNEWAVKKIYKAKGRPSDNPLILHVSSVDEIDRLVLEVSDDAKKLIEKFWPGPLTLIFKRSKIVPDIITGGLDTVAIRMPDNIIANQLIKRSGKPIAAPSANTSGRPSPTQASHVYDDLQGKIPIILDGGETGIGLESTVLDMTGDKPMILRPGGITWEEIAEVIGEVEVDESIMSVTGREVPKSPGQKYKHYAPKSDMYVYQGSTDKMVDAINKEAKENLGKNKLVGIMCTDETKDYYSEGIIYSMGSRKDPKSIAHNLFHILRIMDEENVDLILTESIGFSHLGMAVMNRILKASGGKVIKV